MVAWSDLGYCNSVACNVKGSCGRFFLANIQNITHPNAFGLKYVCGCFGNIMPLEPIILAQTR
jgi:hypothetical protein